MACGNLLSAGLDSLGGTGNNVSMTETVLITPIDENDPAFLFRHYQGQSGPQPCRVVLDLGDGNLSADYNPEIGDAVSASVWHGIIRTWTIPTVTALAANQIMRDIAALAQRVLDGATVEWDGSNHVGVLTDDAAQAEQQIVDYLAAYSEAVDDGDLVSEMDADDWWSEGDLPDTLTADTTDEQLEQIADTEAIDASSVNPGYTVLAGALEFLAARREEMRDALRNEAAQVSEEHARLESRRNELIGRLSLWGDSSRAIAERVGLSHVAVQKIATRVNHVHGPGVPATGT